MKLTKRTRVRLNAPLLRLGVMLIAIFGFTVFATINTYETIAQKDVALSDTIRKVRLSAKPETEAKLNDLASQKFNTGSFGIPEKVKLPEANKHVSVVPVDGASAAGWDASKGLSQTFLTAQPRQKVFGQAVIYLRVNTPTTSKLGSVYVGDTVNIVTTEGWQLGYKVSATAQDVSELFQRAENLSSEIIMISIDEETGQTTAFRATLTKVGERV